MLTVSLPITCILIFFFNDAETTEIYTLPLHDALPICHGAEREPVVAPLERRPVRAADDEADVAARVAALLQPLCEPLRRSEEHTSELQSRQYLVCRLLLEKKKKTNLTSL